MRKDSNLDRLEFKDNVQIINSITADDSNLDRLEFKAMRNRHR